MNEICKIAVAVAVIILVTMIVLRFSFEEERRLAAAAKAEQLPKELDRASEKMRTLIETQQSRLGGKVVLADPGLFDSGEIKTDVSVKIKYLLWQIEVSIMLQKIEAGKTPGGAGDPAVPGLSIEKPVGASHK